MHKIKKTFLFLVFITNVLFAQDDNNQRISQIENQLEILATEVTGLNEVFKTEISVTNLTLSNLLLAVADIHKLNINPAQELNTQNISPSFPNVIVSDLLIFLCKEYNLTIDFTGTIMSVKRYMPEPEKQDASISFDPNNELISIDAKDNNLYDVFKEIMNESGKNLVFTPGLENKKITTYIKSTPFDSAMNNLALANNLYVQKSQDGFYLFEDGSQSTTKNLTSKNTTSHEHLRRSKIRTNTNFFFKVINAEQQLLEVDFINTPIANIINDIGNELNLDIFTATPLDEAGTVTFKAKKISFDDLLTNLFESQVKSVSTIKNSQNSNNQPSNTSKIFNFKKEGSIYFFGTENQLSIREVAIIHLQHRSVELLSDPSALLNSRNIRRNPNTGFENTSSLNNRNFSQNANFSSTNRNRDQLSTNTRDNFNNYSNQIEALVNILPNEVKQDLDIKVDYELNSFYVSGPSANIKRFKTFIDKIDKPVPVILIEVMILEVSKSSLVETGISWGIGEESTTTQGGIYPETNLTLGAKTINKVIGSFNGFGYLNIGKVVPNFFATIKAMESNGDLKIRSTPKLSTLNGHRATFSNGQTSYYTVTDQSIIGSDNPITQTALNYVPIDVELGLTIKPIVSGDGQVTLDIFVIQSNFGDRIDEDAPPDITSREFKSIIRVENQDIVVLGGLEEQLKNNSGSGVPLLARIPIIKWLFSKRKREASKAKLTVLIKPTVID